VLRGFVFEPIGRRRQDAGHGLVKPTAYRRPGFVAYR